MSSSYFRNLSLAGILFVLLSPLTVMADSSQHLVQMLDYIGVDYPPTVKNGEVIDDFEYTEMVEFSAALRSLLDTMPANSAKASLYTAADNLQQLIKDRRAGDQVAALTQSMKANLISSYALIVGPADVPDVANLPQLFETHCAGCHGQQGYGDGVQAVGMEPAPSDFHDMERQYSRSVYDLYNTITLGVNGTPMPAFPQLSESQRWALSLMVSEFSASETQREQGKLLWQQGKLQAFFPSLSNLTGMSYAKAEELGNDIAVDGKAILAYLRSDPAAVVVSDNVALDNSIAMLAESVQHARQGDKRAAYKAALSAYLDGFEMAEPSLSVIDKPLTLEIEQGMIGFRELAKTGNVTEMEPAQEKLQAMLYQAKNQVSSTRMSGTAAFFSSFVILLREGVEAILVLAAIMAALIKTGRKEAMIYIHAGWIGAIIMGVATWWVAENLIAISGASREITEGIAALFAAVILLYVGFWLHNASNSKRWQQFVQHKIGNAMESSTLWVLATVSFVAVYREMFETVLFYQALWVQIDEGSEQGFLSGILAAIALLVVLAFIILKVGTRLPIKQFFQINAVLLFLLAVVFTGQGIAALQEAGFVSSSILDFPRIEWLGIYPTMQSLSLQFIVLLMGVGMMFYHKRARNAAA